MFKDRRLLLIYTIMLIDVIIGSATGPVMPEFVKRLDKPQFWLSIGTALFLGIQLFSAPLIGKLSDDLGRRPLAIVSSIGTAIANAFLLPVKAGLFFANRVSDGITNGMYTSMRSAVTEISTKETILRNNGYITTIASLGNILGPMVSGALLTLVHTSDGAEGQTRLVITLALGLAAVNIVLSFFFKETCDHPSGLDKQKIKNTVIEALSVHKLWTRVKEKDQERPGLRWLVMLLLVYTVAQGSGSYLVAYISMGKLHFNAAQISYYFMFFGGACVLTNFVFYNYLVDRVNRKKTIIAFAWTGVALYLSYANVGSSPVALYITTAVDACSLALLGGMLNAIIAEYSSEEGRGELFGLTQALTGLTSLVTTLIYGGLSAVNVELPFYWFSASMVVVGLLALRLHEPETEEAKVEFHT